MDITNIVTDENVFLTILEIPENSMPPKLFAQHSIMQIFTSGIIKTTRKLSVIDIKSIIIELESVALDIFPLIICIEAIIGANAFIA
jgi:hypothetical protein